MTATVTDAAVAAITTTRYATFSAAAGACAILLLLILLVERELLQAFRGRRSSFGSELFDPAIAPLLCACGLIIAARLVLLVLGR
jgi:hypothetical protein